MLDIEEIKWGCGFADGFSCNPDGTLFVNDKYYNDCHKSIKGAIDSLFLQRVIEGINNNGDYIVETNHWCINIYNRHSYDLIKQFDFYEDIEGIDQAKEQAIKYLLVEGKEC